MRDVKKNYGNNSHTNHKIKNDSKLLKMEKVKKKKFISKNRQTFIGEKKKKKVQKVANFK